MTHPQQVSHAEILPRVAPLVQPTAPVVDSQLCENTITTTRSSLLQRRKRRMNTEERGVHTIIRNFYKRMEKVGQLLLSRRSFGEVCGCYRPMVLLCGLYVFFCRSNPKTHSLTRGPFSTCQKEHGDLVEDCLTKLSEEAPSMSRSQLRALLKEHFKYKRCKQ